MAEKRIRQSHEIINSQRAGDTEVVLGYSTTEVFPYATWKCCAQTWALFFYLKFPSI